MLRFLLRMVVKHAAIYQYLVFGKILNYNQKLLDTFFKYLKLF